jgi:hypothetical protein
MYHRFSNIVDPFKVHKDTFEKQLLFFKKHFNIICLEEYIRLRSEKGIKEKIHINPMVITIDDGYLDNYTIAYPILKKWKVPATVFITTNFVNKGEWLWAERLEYILLNTKKKIYQFQLNGVNHDFQVGNFNDWHRTQWKFSITAVLPDEDKNQFLNNLSTQLDIRVPRNHRRLYCDVLETD